MNKISFESGSYYIYDRGYMDTEMLYLIHKTGEYFIVREKVNQTYVIIEDHHYINPETGIMRDLRIRFTGYQTYRQYPEVLRRVEYYATEEDLYFVFYTNNLQVSAEDVSLLY